MRAYTARIVYLAALPTQTSDTPSRSRAIGVALALLATTAVAFILRFQGLHFGLPQQYTRPDEETISALAARISWGQLDPRFFRYPTLFMYAMAGLIHVGVVPSPLVDAESFFVASRTISALLGAATVPLLFFAVKRVTSTSAALIASALLAVTFLHVRDSHFGVTDVPATFLIVGALAAITAGPFKRPTFINVAWAGLLCGLAASTKYNCGLILVTLLVVVGSMRLALAGTLASVVGFLLGTPYAYFSRKKFLADLLAERAHLSGGHVVGATIGWIHHAVFSLRWGLGLLFLLAADMGIVMLARERNRRALVLLAFPLTYYVIIGSGYTAFTRYMTPLTPFMAVFAAVAIVRCVRWIAGRWSTRMRIVALALLTIAVGTDSLTRAIALDKLLTVTDSRALAAAFVHDRYPRGVSTYQTGTAYGQVELSPVTEYPEWPLDFSPKIVLVESSLLTAYAHRPPELDAHLSQRYHLIWRTETKNPSSAAVPIFDQQDAFFAPLNGFDAVVRPGPDIEIYELADAVARPEQKD